MLIDKEVSFVDAASNGQQSFKVKIGTVDQEITANESGNNSTPNEKTVNLQTSEKCFNESIGRELVNLVDTVEDTIQNAILTAMDIIIIPRLELAVRPMNVSSRQNAAIVMGSSEREEHKVISASFENVSERNNTLYEPSTNDESRRNVPGEVSELSVPGTHFDRQSHTHHRNKNYFFFRKTSYMAVKGRGLACRAPTLTFRNVQLTSALQYKQALISCSHCSCLVSDLLTNGYLFPPQKKNWHRNRVLGQYSIITIGVRSQVGRTGSTTYLLYQGMNSVIQKVPSKVVRCQLFFHTKELRFGWHQVSFYGAICLGNVFLQ